MGVLSVPTGTSPSRRKKFCIQQPRAEADPKGPMQWKKLTIWGQEIARGAMLGHCSGFFAFGTGLLVLFLLSSLAFRSKCTYCHHSAKSKVSRKHPVEKVS